MGLLHDTYVYMKTNVLETSKIGLCGVPNLYCINIRTNHIFKMRRHCTAVYFGAISRFTNSFGNVKYNTREPIRVDPDFLIIGYLAELTSHEFSLATTKELNRATYAYPIKTSQWLGAALTSLTPTHLTSANFSGRSQTMAPPYSGVSTYPGISIPGQVKR